MDIQQALIMIVDKWSLLKNPFYQAWSRGTLPVTALQLYASEYANLIALLPKGWQAVDDLETAQEEQEHDNLWKEFVKSIGVPRSTAQLSQTKTLVKTAKKLFSKPVTSLGALYAFEVQQPLTASSKLAGLKKHYRELQGDETYFTIHARNQHESEKLLQRIEQLSPKEQVLACKACEKMSQALWDMLTALHDQTLASQ